MDVGYLMFMIFVLRLEVCANAVEGTLNLMHLRN